MARAGEAGPLPEEVQERKLEALRLRRRGKSYEAIGKILGVSAVMAWKYVTGEIQRRSDELREEQDQTRSLELERLDTLLDRLWDRIDSENPSLDHMEMYFKIASRRAKLLGLDAAGKSEVTIKDGRPDHVPDQDLYKRVRELQERLARLPGAKPSPILFERSPFEGAQEPAIDVEVVKVVAPAKQPAGSNFEAKGPKCIQMEPETGAPGEKEGPEGPSLYVGELEKGVVGVTVHDAVAPVDPPVHPGALLERDPDGK